MRVRGRRNAFVEFFLGREKEKSKKKIWWQIGWIRNDRCRKIETARQGKWSSCKWTKRISLKQISIMTQVRRKQRRKEIQKGTLEKRRRRRRWENENAERTKRSRKEKRKNKLNEKESRHNRDGLMRNGFKKNKNSWIVRRASSPKSKMNWLQLLFQFNKRSPLPHQNR